MKKLYVVVLGSFLLIVLGAGIYFSNIWKRVISSQPLTPVVVAFKWLNQAQFAGHYVAVDNDYYRENGLSVTLVPFDMKQSPIDLVLAGTAQFGVVGADELLLARSVGKPVVAIATIYQESPVVAFVLDKSSIRSVADFKGKKLGISPDKNVRMMMEELLTRSGVNPKKDVTFVDIGFDYSGLKNGTIDIAAGYAINEPLNFVREGFPVRVFKPSNVGIKNYADVLFTSESFITNNPVIVRGFVAASLKGWEYALKNPQPTILSVLTHMGVNINDESAYEQQTQMLEASRSLIKSSESQRVGEMTYVRWNQLYQQMQKAGLITPININSAYTNQFLSSN